MILNVYNKFKEDPSYTKLVAGDFMILEYKCPIDVDKLQVYLETNMITYVVSGKKDWISGDRTYHIKEGDAIFLRKGVYTIRQFLDQDHCVLVFFIQDDFIRNFMRENRVMTISPDGAPESAFPLEVDEPLQSLFQSIFSYMKLQPEIPRNLVEIKFKELLFNLVINARHRKLVQFFSSLCHPAKTTLDEVMSKNFQYDLELEEFAQLCGRSLSTFKREFKNVYHQTPGKWLTNKRLEYATELLLSSHLNINEIGCESGFKNSSHFTKSFKDKYQVTPKQFRSASRTKLNAETVAQPS
jgi:AraC-like DNA-binding protein